MRDRENKIRQRRRRAKVRNSFTLIAEKIDFFYTYRIEEVALPHWQSSSGDLSLFTEILK